MPQKFPEIKRYTFHLNQIYSQGWQALLRKTQVILLVFAPLCLLAAILIIFLRPWIFIRLIPISGDPIGHITTETELNYLDLLRLKESYRKRYPERNTYFVNIYYLRGGICNKTIYKLLKKRFYFINRYIGKLISVTLKILKFYSNSPRVSIKNRDRKFERESIENPLRLLKKHEKKFLKIEEILNIDLSLPYACILNRESTYHKNLRGDGSDVDAHNTYRNVNINDFIPVIRFLNEKNFQVVRMGSDMIQTINYKNKFFYDYAASNAKSDFFDILLSAKCEFFISVSSGLDMIAHQFRKPVYYLNVAPLSHVLVANKTIFMPKLLFDFVNKQFVHIKSKEFMRARFLLKTNEIEAQNLVYKDNSEDEIHHFAIELLAYHKGELELSKSQTKMQNRFWSNFPFNSELHYRKLHQAIISPYFLEKNANLLL